MDNYNKYIGLLALIMGLFASILLFFVGIFYTMKVFSIVFFDLPGTAFLFEYVVTLTPFVIYFTSYYFLNRKIISTEKLTAKISSRIFMSIGILTAIFFMTLALMDIAGVQYEWVRLYKRYSYLTLISQILFLFFTTLSLATGDKKEIDWMDREQSA